MTTGKTITFTRWIIVGKVTFLLFNMLSRLAITFLPRSKHLLISWLQSPSAVILEPKKRNSVTVSIVSPSICHEVMRPDAMILVYLLRNNYWDWNFSIKEHANICSFYWVWLYWLLTPVDRQRSLLLAVCERTGISIFFFFFTKKEINLVWVFLFVSVWPFLVHWSLMRWAPKDNEWNL